MKTTTRIAKRTSSSRHRSTAVAPKAKAPAAPRIKARSIWFKRADNVFVEHRGEGNKPFCATSRFKARKDAGKPGADDKSRPCRVCKAIEKKVGK